MSREEKAALDSPPHPVSGWLVAIALPAHHQPGPQPEEHPMGELLKERFGFALDVFHMPQSGIAAAVVVEIGPLPDDERIERLVPFNAGATVYFPDDRGVMIGDFTYLRTDSVLAYEDAPR